MLKLTLRDCPVKYRIGALRDRSSATGPRSPILVHHGIHERQYHPCPYQAGDRLRGWSSLLPAEPAGRNKAIWLWACFRHPEVIHLAESGVCGLRSAKNFADIVSRTLAPGATRYTAAAFRCDQSSLLSARRHELAHIGVRHAEAFFEGLGEIGAVVAWVVELILIFNVQPAGVSCIG